METQELRRPPFVINEPEYSSEFTILDKDGKAKPSYVIVGTNLEKKDKQIHTTSVGSKELRLFLENTAKSANTEFPFFLVDFYQKEYPHHFPDYVQNTENWMQNDSYRHTDGEVKLFGHDINYYAISVTPARRRGANEPSVTVAKKDDVQDKTISEIVRRAQNCRLNDDTVEGLPLLLVEEEAHYRVLSPRKLNDTYVTIPKSGVSTIDYNQRATGSFSLRGRYENRTNKEVHRSRTGEVRRAHPIEWYEEWGPFIRNSLAGIKVVGMPFAILRRIIKTNDVEWDETRVVESLRPTTPWYSAGALRNPLGLPPSVDRTRPFYTEYTTVSGRDHQYPSYIFNFSITPARLADQ